MKVDLDYLYRLLGMKEVELQATREDRDNLRKELDILSKTYQTLKDQHESIINADPDHTP